jgi:uncharacterized repeat protein (TIGR01451 family)
MQQRLTVVSRLAIGVFMLLAPAMAWAAPGDAKVRAQLSELRLPFIVNQGQVDARVAYYAPTFAGTLFVTQQGELVYGLPARVDDAPRSRPPPSSSRSGWSLSETFIAGRPRPVAEDRSDAGVSYFLGSDPGKWRPKAATYEQVSLGEVWPGVTVSLRARGKNVEKVFTVRPGASADRIRVRVRGASALSLDSEGALLASTGLGPITFTAPKAYQERDGVRHHVPVAYRLMAREYRFIVGSYDPALPLVIDPLLQSTYLGGGLNDVARALAIHPSTGDVYVAGETESTNFPGTTGGAQAANGGGNGNRDAFVARLNSALTTLIQATYLGGSNFDFGEALAIHPSTGDVYVAGRTLSANGVLPPTGGGFPGTTGGAQAVKSFGYDAFVARLDSTLTELIQATYLGGGVFQGGENDFAQALAIHPSTGDVYVAGYTESTNFPGTTGGALGMQGGTDAFVARLNSALTMLTQATYYGGTGNDFAQALAIHPSTGDVYMAGHTESDLLPTGTGDPAQAASGGGGEDAFVARLNSSLTALIQATFLGGDSADQASALAIHPSTGGVYVVGSTTSTNFPGTPGGAQAASGGGNRDAFVAHLNSALAALVQATYLGGSLDDFAQALAIHPSTGDVYVAGYTNSPNFPATTGGVQAAVNNNLGFNFYDAFVARLNSALTTLTQATYLGGDGDDQPFGLAIHPSTGDVYLAGHTGSTNFPHTSGGAQPAGGTSLDAFIARLTFGLALVDPAPDLTITKTHNGNFAPGQVGATYTMTVSNVGTAASSGTVTVTDTLPTGLTATGLGGSGWTCTLGTVTCTRGNALASGSSYPAITLTVTVASNAPSSVTNTATVSGGGDVNPSNDTANDQTTVAGAIFGDVPIGHAFFDWIEALFKAGITGGCATNPLLYCPDAGVTRGQMAVFLLRGIHGASYQPPDATGMFTDVSVTPPTAHPFAKWIEQLAREGITSGCSTSPPEYCPDDGVTRGQMAVFLLRAKHGAGYQPPDATGMFTDVPVTPPTAHPFAKWIEQLAREGITSGCSTSPPQYCPNATVTRGQMAVFLVRAFGLPM